MFERFWKWWGENPQKAGTCLSDKIIDYGFLHDLTDDVFVDLIKHVDDEKAKRITPLIPQHGTVEQNPDMFADDPTHIHDFKPGLAPGNVHLNICKICGHTEVVNPVV